MPLGFDKLIRDLTANSVEFLLIGANAAIAHGAPIGTLDLDICYRHTKGNCTRLASVLTRYKPELRGAPAGLPFRCDGPTLLAGSNFTFTTSAGDVDILGHVSGVGGYEALAKNAVPIEFLGMTVLVMSLEDLYKSKKAAGRPKDQFHITHIETLLKLRKQ